MEYECENQQLVWIFEPQILAFLQVEYSKLWRNGVNWKFEISIVENTQGISIY